MSESIFITNRVVKNMIKFINYIRNQNIHKPSSLLKYQALSKTILKNCIPKNTIYFRIIQSMKMIHNVNHFFFEIPGIMLLIFKCIFSTYISVLLKIHSNTNTQAFTYAYTHKHSFI